MVSPAVTKWRMSTILMRNSSRRGGITPPRMTYFRMIHGDDTGGRKESERGQPAMCTMENASLSIRPTSTGRALKTCSGGDADDIVEHAFRDRCERGCGW